MATLTPKSDPIPVRKCLPIQNKQAAAVLSWPAVPVFQLMKSEEDDDLQLKKKDPGLTPLALPAMPVFQMAEKPEQKVANQTGLPDHLKTGIENLSGFSLDDVKVHYNSSKPAQLNALAYAQGANIHVAPGQEKHLPHEAWHVVQQKQGRVNATMQMKGALINDDKGLEQEADWMGQKALQMQSDKQIAKQNNPDLAAIQIKSVTNRSGIQPIIQRRVPAIGEIYQVIETDANWQESGRKIQSSLIRTIGQLTAVQKNNINNQLNAEDLDLTRSIEDYTDKNTLKRELGRMAELIIDQSPDSKHPGDMKNGPVEDVAQSKRINDALTKVASYYRSFAGSESEKIIEHIFGKDKLKQAKKNFGDAAAAMEKFIKESRVWVDKRGDFKIKNVGALTGVESMTLPKYFGTNDITVDDLIKIGHEAMHAVPPGNIRDIIYRGTPAFVTLGPEQKLLNADHYAVVLAIKLGKATMNDVTQTQPLPGLGNVIPNQPNPRLQAIHKEIETYFTYAWVMALWVQENMAKIREASKDMNAQYKESTFYKNLIMELSPMYGMTIHERNRDIEAATKFPYIRDIDLIIAEDIVNDLGSFIGYMKRGQIQAVDNIWELPSDSPGILNSQLNTFNDTAIEDLIKEQAFVNLAGKYSKDYEMEKRIVEKLYRERIKIG